MEAWIRLETALRKALPVCSIQPPTQPSELLSALRINGRIGPDEESRILALREIRNRVAHGAHDPSPTEANELDQEIDTLTALLGVDQSSDC
jgi:uncharacterized protein YutE (UPF0331/DUF86 family)